ncbi:MAG TPA: MMPL family transporter [Candidatus Saccharimonadales bacterium]
MATFLHKVGATMYRHSWQVIAAWAVILTVLGFTAFTFMKPTSSAISIPGTEAQKAIDRSQELFHDSGKGSGRIVFQTKHGKEIADFKSDITKLTNDVAKVDGISATISPFAQADKLISGDKTIAYIPVQLDKEVGAVEKSTLGDVEALVSSTRQDDLQVEMGGGLVSKTPGEILGIGEIAGVVLALVVLFMTLGSLIAAGMPIVTALVAVGASTLGLFSLGQLFTINTTTPVLGIMLGLAVGIDYSLFIISKYRTLLIEGYKPEVATARAIGTAGNAVVFAALTVVIALAALSIVNVPFMTTMGLAGAASIAIAALVAITLIPALLRLAGLKIFGKKTRAKVLAAQKHTKKKTRLSHNTFWYRWGEAITRRPWVALIIAVAVIGVVAIPAKDLTLGLPTDEYAAASTTERKAYDLVSKGFSVGYNGPLAVVVEDLPKVSRADEDSIRKPAEKEMNKQIAAAKKKQEAYFMAKAARVTTLEGQMALQQEVATAEAKGDQQLTAAQKKIDESVEQYAKYVQLKKISDRIAENSSVKEALPVTVKDNGTAGIIQVIPESAPSDKATSNLIESLRDESEKKKLTADNGATLAVTGTTALQNDINAKLAAALPEYLAVVVGLSLVLLIIAFRSILVPLKATLGFLLSVLAMFGAVVAVFQWGWFGIADAPGPIVSFIPIISIGILFGLAMDYEFFLVSGMHEEFTHTKDAKSAVVRGFGAGSKVVTAAAVIMISVFAGFITNHDVTIQAIGFGLAFGILIDAFLVRMTIVPAVMTLLGKSAWWLPKWLDKFLPHVSIEGEEAK